MNRDEKNWEIRLRFKARRQGLRLMKSRRRDPDAPDYGDYYLVDDSSNAMVLETYDLADIENYLTHAKDGV